MCYALRGLKTDLPFRGTIVRPSKVCRYLTCILLGSSRSGAVALKRQTRVTATESMSRLGLFYS